MSRGVFIENGHEMDWLERAEGMRRAVNPNFNRVINADAPDDVSHHSVDRDPCPMCGTRADFHNQFGCKNGRGK